MTPAVPTKFRTLLDLLTSGGVEFIVVGGVAGIAHGSARVTQDLDVVYRRIPDNLDRIVRLFAPLRPYPRGAPPGLPFMWDRRTVEFGLNFTLETTIGVVDLLGVIAGGDYDQLKPHSIELEAFGVRCWCLDLDTLIRTKRAAGRPKDFEAIAELELLEEEQREPGGN